MAYQSLYRRYRPHRFSDVRGQEHIVRALRNAVREERVGHAYLFSGPRGTGKTSTARILAKALNCEHLTDGEPCGTCESCLAIDAGTSYDVQELDAASNNGVNDIRDLIGRVNLGSPGRTKVYILDEVHMLSPSASAALLKTLEEPPAHVVFVLATTDPQKVLPTIRSRTQHFDFHLLSVDELTEHVAWVIHDAALGLDDDVIEHVVRAGAGSARDTLSALDQVAAAGGVVDRNESLDDLLDAVAEGDAGKALVAVADAVATGRDPRLLGEAVLARLRDVFLVRMGAATDHLAPGDIDRVKAWADQLGDRATTRALEAVGDALLEMRQAPDPRIPLEVALVKITRAGGDGSLDALVARVAALEAALAAGGAPAGGPTPAPAPGRPTPPPPAAGPGPAPAAPAPARPVPPPHPGARPADGARAQLAAKRSERGSGPASGAASPGPAAAPPPGPSPSAAPATGGTPAPTAPAGGPSGAPPSPAPEPETATADRTPSGAGAPAPPEPTDGPTTSAPSSGAPTPPTPAPGPVSAPSGTPPAAPPAPEAAPTRGAAPTAPGTGSGLPDREALAALWTETVLPGLGGLTKAMYAVGRFTEVSGTTAVFALPNEVHRQKCDQKRADVERALAERVGVGLTLRLVVDADAEAGGPSGGGSGAGGGGGRGPGPGRGGSSPAADDDFDLGGTDVHELDDAPDAPSSGIDALTEAFPGATLENP